MTTCYCNGMDPECPLCRGSGKRGDCTLCNGLRRIAVDDPEGIQKAYKAVPCPRCANKGVAEIHQASGLTPEMQKWTFAAMVTGYPQLDEIATEMKRVLHEGKGWVVMSSHPGPGKSYLLASLVNEALGQRKSAFYTFHTALMDDFIAARMGAHRESFQALMRRLTGIQFLAIDEFGVGTLTDFKSSTLRQLLGARSDGTGYTPTFFATNEEPDFFEKELPWLHDRFFDKQCKRYTLDKVPSLRGRI